MVGFARFVLLFLATTARHTPSVLSTGSSLVKSNASAVRFPVKKNGRSCQICSSTVLLKTSASKKKKKRKTLSQKFQPLKLLSKIIKMRRIGRLMLRRLKALLSRLLRSGLLVLGMDSNRTGRLRTIGMLALLRLNGHKFLTRLMLQENRRFDLIEINKKT